MQHEQLAQRHPVAGECAKGLPADETLVTAVYAHVTPQLRKQLGEVMAIEGRSVNEGTFPL